MYQVVWPRGKSTAEAGRFARRLDTLDGETICALWDWAFKGDQVFPALGKELARRYPGLKFVSYEAFGSTLGGEEAKTLAGLPDKLKLSGCDAAVSAMGC